MSELHILILRIKRRDPKWKRRIRKTNRIVSRYSQVRGNRERTYREMSSENLMRELWIKETRHEILSPEQSQKRSKE